MKRIYKIVTSSENKTVHPINDEALVYKWKRVKDSLVYNKELSTKLLFSNNKKENINDFDFFYSFEKNISTRCEVLIIEIYKICNGNEILEFKGIMPLNTGEWDLDRCTVKLEIKNNFDVYDCINENKKETQIAVSNFYQTVSGLPNVSCDYSVADFDTTGNNIYFGTPPDKPFGLYSNFVIDEYIQIYSVGLKVCLTDLGRVFTAVGNGVWVETAVNGALSSSASQLLFMYDYNGAEYIYPTVSTLNTSVGFYNERVNPSNTSFYELPFIKFHTLCHLVVAEMLYKCGLPTTKLDVLKSDFFDWNAIGDTMGYVASIIPALTNVIDASDYPTGYYNSRYLFTPLKPGTNYVTGQQNKLTNLLYMPKSNSNNITASTWEQPSILNGSILEVSENRLSFEEIEKIWANVFQAYWFIDTDGAMRVEHISWFNNNSTVYDSTLSNSNKYNVANKKYTYDKSVLPRKEIFKFAQNRDFINGRVDVSNNKNNEIFYDSVCINLDKDNNEITTEITKITTDIIGLNSQSDEKLKELYGTSGIFLCDVSFSNHSYLTLFNGTTVDFYRSLIEATINYETLHLNSSLVTHENAHVQWANLIRRYLRDNRVLTTGINGQDLITFTARTRKSKVQQGVILKYCCEDEVFNPQQAIIKTELGDGIIDEAEYNTKTGLIKIKALHD